jgi:hypothetical protein
MVDLDAMAEEQDRSLKALTDLAMAFARKLDAKVELVTSVEETAVLARAFDRVLRGARLTIALRSRLVRDRREIDKLDRAAAQKAAGRRKDQVKAVLEAEIFTDHRDQESAETLYERLTDRLDREALFDAFLSGPVEAAIARIRKDLELEEGDAESDPPPGRSPIEGQVDRAERREPEGVAAHSHLSGLQPPHPVSPGAPPEGEHLGGSSLRPTPS